MGRISGVVFIGGRFREGVRVTSGVPWGEVWSRVQVGGGGVGFPCGNEKGMGVRRWGVGWGTGKGTGNSMRTRLSLPFEFLPEFSSFSMGKVRAARLQNEAAPERVLIRYEQDTKNRRRSEKCIRNVSNSF